MHPKLVKHPAGNYAPNWGGARKGPGFTPGTSKVAKRTVYLLREQDAAYRRLGGQQWLRKVLDEAIARGQA